MDYLDTEVPPQMSPSTCLYKLTLDDISSIVFSIFLFVLTVAGCLKHMVDDKYVSALYSMLFRDGELHLPFSLRLVSVIFNRHLTGVVYFIALTRTSS
jgi:hypothetical protein